MGRGMLPDRTSAIRSWAAVRPASAGGSGAFGFRKWAARPGETAPPQQYVSLLMMGAQLFGMANRPNDPTEEITNLFRCQTDVNAPRKALRGKEG